ncbi:MAG TPA: monovalent cation/H+ antiporter complex subunit F [Actinomycetota bacterium]|jgi:multisubunit Na+/H+ antiporter MnhF subunit
MWLWFAAAFLLVLVPCGIRAVRGSTFDRLLGMQLGGVVASLALVMLGEGFGRSIYVDLGVVLGVLSFAGTLAFIRLLERWV